MKNILIIFLLSIGSITAHAQTQLRGVAYDADTRNKMKLVFVNNLTQKEVDHTGQRGDFAVKAEMGDLIVFTCPGYKSDTLVVESLSSVVVVLKPRLIVLDEVIVKANSYKKKEDTKRDYAAAYSVANTSVLTKDGSLSLTNLFSKQSQQKRAFRKFIDLELNEKTIDRRFNRALVSDLTNIRGQVLEDYMSFFRPTYSEISKLDDAQLRDYIIKSYNEYIQMPAESRIYPPLLKTTY
ncbi:MAG: hypothetical protein EAZ51_02605 [Sphingobacteriales bacterium]|nr:MAG: hypothetical protein EAZ64_03540 [Sphingobacteriales bacterium]TAF82438.1 MAG: hypothetical protein EAZ51_02605 [Sphingobacteriales bacterium]